MLECLSTQCCIENNLKMASVLVMNGANPNVQVCSFPLAHIAFIPSKYLLFTVFLRFACVVILCVCLLLCGCMGVWACPHTHVFTVKDHDWWTPLHAAAACGQWRLTNFLLTHGADATIVNSDGELAIDIVEGDRTKGILNDEMARLGS